MFVLAGRWPWSPYDAAVPRFRDQKRTSRLLLAPSPVLFQTGRGALIDVPQRTPTQLLTPLACSLDGLAKTSNGIGILHRNHARRIAQPELEWARQWEMLGIRR